MSLTDEEKRETRTSKWKFAAAALFTIGLASTLSQVLAVAVFGDLGEVLQPWSTGGVIALAGAVVVANRCERWADFPGKIWIWLVISAVVGFATMGYYASRDQAGLEAAGVV